MPKPICCRIKLGASFIKNPNPIFLLTIALNLVVAPVFAKSFVSEKFRSHIWKDQTNKAFRFSGIKSGIYGVAVAYTDCKSVCPMVRRQLEIINEKLIESRHSLPVYFISINPKQDTLKKQKEFLKGLASEKRYKYLRTDESTTRKLLEELKMGFSEIRTTGHSMHTMSVALLNSDGEILGLIPVISDDTAVAVGKIRLAMEEKKKTGK